MNKTTSINIGGKNFFIEDEAFEKLNSYLITIKSHFSQYPGSQEIVDDMENRIAEKFSENAKNDPQAVVTLANVNHLISELGTVEDFSSEEGVGRKSGEKTSKESIAPKRLMRDPDDKIIAGVCSGLGAYFGIDPLIFRLISGLLLFAGGSIVPLYILLWLIMPEAKTPTEKMQMRGEPLNMGSLRDTIKERAEEFKQHVNKHAPDVKEKAQTMGQEAVTTAKRSGSAFGNVIRILGATLVKILMAFIRIILKIIGFCIVISAVIAIASVTLAAALSIFNAHSPYLGLPLGLIAHGAIYFVLVVLAYIIVIIPLQFLTLLGFAMLGNRKSLTPAKSFGLLGLWLAALIIGGVLGLQHVPEYIQQIKSSPQMQTVNKSYDLKDFHNLKLTNSNRYRLIQGDSFSIKAEGSSIDMDRLQVSNDNGTLIVGTNTSNSFCIFCFRRGVALEITAPNFDSISAENSSSVQSDMITGTSTTLSLSNSADANIYFQVQNLTVSLSNSSDARLNGTAKSLKATLENSSRLNGTDLMAQEADITTTNVSDAHVYVTGTLKYQSSNNSQIFYLGTPQLESHRGPSDNYLPMPISPSSRYH
jgi:phage shock protein PspC (stress-responsive transcriptional regulator)